MKLDKLVENLKELTEGSVDTDWLEDPIYKKMVASKVFEKFTYHYDYPKAEDFEKWAERFETTKARAKMFYQLWKETNSEEVDREDMPKKGYQGK